MTDRYDQAFNYYDDYLELKSLIEAISDDMESINELKEKNSLTTFEAIIFKGLLKEHEKNYVNELKEKFNLTTLEAVMIVVLYSRNIDIDNIYYVFTDRLGLEF